MGNKTKEIQDELKQMIFFAVMGGARTPGAVVAYLIDNGWEYDLPTKPTIIHLLNENGVEYVSGYWTKTR